MMKKWVVMVKRKEGWHSVLVVCPFHHRLLLLLLIRATLFDDLFFFFIDPTLDANGPLPTHSLVLCVSASSCSFSTS